MELLTEKYRPSVIEDLVNPTGNDNSFIEKLSKWKEDKQLDGHLLFFGPAGTGKSSTVRVIINELGITDTTIVNGSDKTSVDDVRKLIDYASIPPIDGFKLIVIEEFERLSPQAQDSLKYVMEKYSSWCRFILTTNNISKVTLPIISRCELFNFKDLDKRSFVNKIIKILEQEKVQYSLDNLTEYIKMSYPDLRKCINLISKNINKKVLEKLNKEEVISNDKFDDILKFYFKSKDVVETRKFISEQLPEEEYLNFYKYMYMDLNKITTDQSKWDDILMKIRDYILAHSTIAYPDMNLMCCLIELKNIVNK